MALARAPPGIVAWQAMKQVSAPPFPPACESDRNVTEPVEGQRAAKRLPRASWCVEQRILKPPNTVSRHCGSGRSTEYPPCNVASCRNRATIATNLLNEASAGSSNRRSNELRDRHVRRTHRQTHADRLARVGTQVDDRVRLPRCGRNEAMHERKKRQTSSICARHAPAHRRERRRRAAQCACARPQTQGRPCSRTPGADSEPG